MKKFKLNVGDVFIIPTGDGRAGVGQVLGTWNKAVYYFAVFDLVLPLEEAPGRAAEALSSPVLFLTLSQDAKLYVGHWTVVGKAPVDPAIPFPVYKEAVGTPDNIEVVDLSGKRRRRATPAEAAMIPYRGVVAPVRLERALRATLGLEPWLDAFDDLRAENIVSDTGFFDTATRRGR